MSDLFPETRRPKKARSPLAEGERWKMLFGDAAQVLQDLPPESFDSFVTDPPAGIGFMGKGWDADMGGRREWIDQHARIFRLALVRVKPGAFGFVWALPRTQHWTMTALEDAGWEVRDVNVHLFGSGMPKSTDQSTIPEEWKGWNTALKPAHEAWILVRRAPAGTLAENLAIHRCGALNIDGARLGGSTLQERGRTDNTAGFGYKAQSLCGHELGRWPANVMVSPEAAEELDAQAGNRGAANPVKGTEPSSAVDDGARVMNPRARVAGAFHADSGGPSRFFYCPKPSTSEREAGTDGLQTKSGAAATGRQEGAAALANGRTGAGRGGGRRNHHPTVKSVALMTWLTRLVTPPGGVVLDAFAGSGTTGVAALREGFRFVGIEREPEYIEIAEARLAHALGDVGEGG